MEIIHTHDRYDRPVTRHKYSVKGSGLTNLGPDISAPADEWFEMFTIDPKTNYIYGFDHNITKYANLHSGIHSWGAENATIDALYFKSNPQKLFNRNGTFQKGALSNLIRRLRHDTIAHSSYTMVMLEAKISTLSATLDIDQKVDILQGMDLAVVKCYLTNKILPSSYTRNSRFSTGIQIISRQVAPQDYGYSQSETSRGENIWLLPEEILVQGRVYLRNQLTWCTCPTCSREVPEQSIVDGECISCSDNKYKIHNYSTKVPTLLKFKAKNVKPSTIYLGVELEYESTDKDLAKIKVGKALAGHAIMKSDGSINNGFEIVTCPATLDIHLEEFKRFYGAFPKELFPANNTGMHVHVSRKPLNIFTIGKMTEFLNRNDNKPFIKFIAGRIDNSYARMTDRTVTYPFVSGSGERYNALNLNNTDTIEFRIFSSPKNWEEFASRLEFCQALTDYCQPAQVSAPLKQLTGYRSFLHWVTLNRKAYPELSNSLKGFA